MQEQKSKKYNLHIHKKTDLSSVFVFLYLQKALLKKQTFDFLLIEPKLCSLVLIQ